MIFKEYPDKIGQYYLVYERSIIPNYSGHSIILWKYHGSDQVANHSTIGSSIWTIFFLILNNTKTFNETGHADNCILYLDFYDLIFFELTEEEFEKHVLIYEL